MQYIDKFIVDENGASLGEVFNTPNDKVEEFTLKCHGVVTSTMATDELLGKDTSKGQMIVEMLRACDPQTDPEVVAAVTCINGYFEAVRQNNNPVMKLLEALLKGNKGDNNGI